MRNKYKHCLVRELDVSELFKLTVKVIKQSCGIEKLYEQISEQIVQCTIKTGTRRNASLKWGSYFFF